MDRPVSKESTMEAQKVEVMVGDRETYFVTRLGLDEWKGESVG